MKMIMEKQMECRLAGETEVLGENLPQRHFCPSQNPTCPDPSLNPDRRGGKPATNRLSYGAAQGYTYRHRDRWEGFMESAVEMGSGAMIYIPSFIKIGSGIQKLLGGGMHIQHADLISVLGEIWKESVVVCFRSLKS
jgi:hypothetical protein